MPLRPFCFGGKAGKKWECKPQVDKKKCGGWWNLAAKFAILTAEIRKGAIG